MEKVDRMAEALRYLIGKSLVSTKKDVAGKMGYSYSNVISALKGNTSYLTDKFIQEFNRSFGGIFNENWIINEKGDMLNPVKSTDPEEGVVLVGGSESPTDRLIFLSVSLQHRIDELKKALDEKERSLKEVSKEAESYKNLAIEKDKEISRLHDTLLKSSNKSSGNGTKKKHPTGNTK